MNNFGLTRDQADVLAFLKRYHHVNGVYPTVREIAKGQIEGQQVITYRKSQGTVQEIMNGLVNRQAIEKQPGRPRAIRVLD
jgi:SOS-response transcriptional repressor LexA